MSLARSVLALHDGIREVFILEAKPGQYAVVDSAIGDGGASILSESIHGTRKHAQLVPAVILGGAAQFAGDPESLQLVAISYRKSGVILANLTEQRFLAISTSPEALYGAMVEVEKGLPRLVELETHEKTGSVNSATEAESIARSYLVERLHAPIFVDEVSYHRVEHRWKILGSYRSSRWTFSKRFQVELNADNGVVMRYFFTSRDRRYGFYLFFVEMACLLAILLTVIVLQRSLWH
jgi:hypothetical protein